MIKMKQNLFTVVAIALLIIVLGVVVIDVIAGDAEDLVKNSILVITTVVGILIKCDDKPTDQTKDDIEDDDDLKN